MEKTEDMMWVARCALLDDRKAFASLVDKYQGRVKRFFLSLTGGDESLSDDLAQETFIKVYYHLRSYKGLSSFSTWLFRVAYNLYYDEWRKRGDRYFEPLDEAAARVLPVRSSTNCTYICLLLLNTVIRGRSAVPETLPRMRVLILSLLSIFVVMIIPV